MNPYTILLGFVSLILLHGAWRERQVGNTRDGWALTICGVGMGSVAALFGVNFS